MIQILINNSLNDWRPKKIEGASLIWCSFEDISFGHHYRECNQGLSELIRSLFSAKTSDLPKAWDLLSLFMVGTSPIKKECLFLPFDLPQSLNDRYSWLFMICKIWREMDLSSSRCLPHVIFMLLKCWLFLKCVYNHLYQNPYFHFPHVCYLALSLSLFSLQVALWVGFPITDILLEFLHTVALFQTNTHAEHYVFQKQIP